MRIGFGRNCVSNIDRYFGQSRDDAKSGIATLFKTGSGVSFFVAVINVLFVMSGGLGVAVA